MPPRRDLKQRTPWAFIPLQSKLEKCGKVWGLSVPAVPLSVQVPQPFAWGSCPTEFNMQLALAALCYLH